MALGGEEGGVEGGFSIITLSGVWCSTYSRLAALFSPSLPLSFPTGGTPTNIPHQSHPLLQLPEDDRGTSSLFLSSLSTSLGQAQLPAERANGDHHELHHTFHLIQAKLMQFMWRGYVHSIMCVIPFITKLCFNTVVFNPGQGNLQHCTFSMLSGYQDSKPLVYEGLIIISSRKVMMKMVEEHEHMSTQLLFTIHQLNDVVLYFLWLHNNIMTPFKQR